MHHPFPGRPSTGELHSLRCSLLLMNGAVTSALNPAKVSFMRLWKPGSISAQTACETVWLERSPGMQGGTADEALQESSHLHTPHLFQALQQSKLGGCHMPSVQLPEFPLRDSASVAGGHKSLRWASGSSRPLPVCRRALWVGHKGVQLWVWLRGSRSSQEGSVCELGHKTGRVWICFVLH